jgi:hypothetical protein
MAAEIISTVGRRPHWPDEEKLRILSEALAPGVAVAAVADRNGVCRSLVYLWLRVARVGRLPGKMMRLSTRQHLLVSWPCSMAGRHDHGARLCSDLSLLRRDAHAAWLRWTEHHGAGRAEAGPARARFSVFEAAEVISSGCAFSGVCRTKARHFVALAVHPSSHDRSPTQPEWLAAQLCLHALSSVQMVAELSGHMMQFSEHGVCRRCDICYAVGG